MEIEESDNRPTVLVVDDVPENLSLMTIVLKNDYRVKVANNGEKALRIARSVPPPELILLDIMMPGMNGYEVCRELKADPATIEIPVIFVTARTDVDDEKQGLDLGAVDYITKPISRQIVLARIRNHLKLKKLNSDLAGLVALRTQELEEACNRLNALDAGSRDYLRTISHELRTPANGLLGIGQLALEEIEDKDLQSEYKELFFRSSNRLLAAIDASLQLANLRTGEPVATAQTDLFLIVSAAALSLQDSFSEKGLVLDPPETQPCFVIANEELLRQSITTLLKAAQRMATTGTRLVCNSGMGDNLVVLQIFFQGRPLSDELKSSFFDTFSYHRSCSFAEDLGLTLPLAAELLRAMGGDVELRKTSSGGEIHLTLLKQSPPF